MPSTYCTYHLGDNLVHLHFLRRVAQKNPGFTCAHYTLPQHLAQLEPLVRDLPQLKLEVVGPGMPPDSLNAWRGTDGFFYHHPHRADFVAFHLEWFAHLSRALGVVSPIRSAADMLFDYPALFESIPLTSPRYDVLLINGAPHSGQFPGYDRAALARLATHIHEAGYRVVTTEKVGELPCTRDVALDVTRIGALAARTRIVAGVSTGPSWTTFNVWSAQTTQAWLLLLAEERVAVAPRTECFPVLPAFEEALATQLSR